jgi:hypothetical protein
MTWAGGQAYAQAGARSLCGPRLRRSGRPTCRAPKEPAFARDGVKRAALTLPGEVDRISGNATLRELNRREAGAILTSVEK